MQELTFEQVEEVNGGGLEETMLGGGIGGFAGGLVDAAGKGLKRGLIGGFKGAVAGAVIAGLAYSGVAVYKSFR